MKQDPKFVALLQAIGLTFYVLGVASLFSNLAGFAPRTAPDPVLAASFFLLLFVLSALISGAILLAYPITLFFNGHRKQALAVVGWSIGWLLMFVLIFFGFIVLRAKIF
ncbi:MAG TPA: hypothetical protein VMC43_02190 [Candidatus Paceibacterota bacterium]|nr:hypothetical protein [Candidatus Paceibacterota bacterium]